MDIYKASAGSGKTYTLANEYIRLLLQGTDAHRRILAVTFTNKSTGEMKERILRELNIKSKNNPQARKALVRLLQDYSQFHVSTIDAFFLQVVRSFAGELGLNSSFQISLDSDEILSTAIDELIYSLTIPGADEQLFRIVEELVEEQIAAGKTWNPKNTLANIAGELLKEQVRQEYLSKMQNKLRDNQWMSQYKQRLYAEKKQFENMVQTEQDNLRTLIQAYDSEGDKVKNVGFAYADMESLIKDEFFKSEVKAIFPDDYEKPDVFYYKTHVKDSLPAAIEWDKNFRPRAQRFYLLLKDKQGAYRPEVRRYCTVCAILNNLSQLMLLHDIQRKINEGNNENNRRPISEITGLLHNVIQNDAPFVYEKTGTRLQHYMIDEFQDTSHLQWGNFLPLLQDADSQGKTNMLVGDEKQSIYRFRQSDWRLLRDAHLHFTHTKEPKMDTNWRSSACIVNNNNDLFKHYIQAITPMAPDVAEAYEHLHQKPAKTELSGRYHLEFVEKTEGVSYSQQVCEKTIQLIRQLHDEQHYPYHEIAILVRKSDVIPDLVEALLHPAEGEPIPVQTAEGTQLDKAPAVQFFITYLRYTQTQDPILLATLRHLLACHCSKLSLDEKEYLCLINMPLFELCTELNRRYHLSEWEGCISYVTAFLDKVYQFTSQKAADICSMLDWWERKHEKFAIPAIQSEAVQILTIHTSKGLEYDCVLIPFANWSLGYSHHQGSFMWCAMPGETQDELDYVPVTLSSSMQQTIWKADYEEEVKQQYMDNLNLTYVAFTRPRRELHIFSPTPTKTKAVNEMSGIHELLYSYAPEGLDEGEPTYYEKEETEPKKELPATYAIQPKKGAQLHLRTYHLDNGEEDPNPTDFGSLMHAWLSTLTQLDDAEQTLDAMCERGLVNDATRQRMLHTMQDFKQLVASQDWFDSDKWNIRNEVSLLSPAGDTLRPDRLLISKDDSREAVIIDYKFAHPSKTHHQQVEDYVSLLKQMGYRCSGYLVYVLKKEIVTVCKN